MEVLTLLFSVLGFFHKIINGAHDFLCLPRMNTGSARRSCSKVNPDCSASEAWTSPRDTSSFLKSTIVSLAVCFFASRRDKSGKSFFSSSSHWTIALASATKTARSAAFFSSRIDRGWYAAPSGVGAAHGLRPRRMRVMRSL